MVRCCQCGRDPGRIWDNGVGERHLLFPNSLDLSKAGVWEKTRRGRRADHFGRQPYRRPLPVADALTPDADPFVSIALEPTAYPLRVRCPRCDQVQGIDAADIDVVVPHPGDPSRAAVTWPLSEPFETIGQPEEEQHSVPTAYSGESDQSVRSFRSPSVGGRGAADARARGIPLLLRRGRQ